MQLLLLYGRDSTPPYKSAACSRSIQKRSNMESIGILPEPDALLSTTIIPLFGILSSPAATDEDYHFCLEKITKGQFCILKLPCCGHQVHTECFKTWAISPQSRVRCAYCRTRHVYKDKCFLCLDKINYQKTSYTNCCH